ncbi:MAG: hypothetical protein M0R37_12120 [Bacteroidales bacterium]|nr:hypothetical protein [Bacteroidales bacterium]
MATFTFSLQGGTPTEVEATDILQFAGGTFDSRIVVDAYNASTHVKTAVGADKSAANTPKNNKFISQAGGGGGDSQVDVGAGTVDLDSVAEADAALKINFADAALVAVVDAVVYGYDGTTPATAPVGVDLRLAEVGNANFTEAEGSGSPCALADQTTPATSHDFFVVASASPVSVGLKDDFSVACELTYY